MRWENTLLLKVSPSASCPVFEALCSWMSRGSSLTLRSQFLFWCWSLCPHLSLFLTLIDLLLAVYKMERSNDDLSDLPSLRFVVPRNTKYPVMRLSEFSPPWISVLLSERTGVWSLIWVFAWGWGTVVDSYTCPTHWPWPWVAPECVQLIVFSKNFFSVSCSVWSLSCVWLFATPWTAARKASLSINNSKSLLKLMSIEPVMPSNHLILCRPFLLPPSIFPSIRVFPSESVLFIKWPKHWSFSFNISPSSEYSGLISFRMDLLDWFTVMRCVSF